MVYLDISRCISIISRIFIELKQHSVWLESFLGVVEKPLKYFLKGFFTSGIFAAEEAHR